MKKRSDMQMSAFGTSVAAQLVIRKWSQRDLARASGVAQPQISRLIKGIGGVNVANARRIAQALGSTVDELIGIGGELSMDARLRTVEEKVRELTDRVDERATKRADKLKPSLRQHKPRRRS